MSTSAISHVNKAPAPVVPATRNAPAKHESAQTAKKAVPGDRAAQRLPAKASATVAPRSTTPGSIIDKKA